MLILAMVVAFSSCKKETIDMTHLLTTVPSSAGGVVVFNVESLLEKAGCKIKDHKVIPGKEVEAFLTKAASGNNKDLMVFLNGDTGIDPTGAVVFYDSNRAFLTFALYDENKFMEFVQKNNNTPFQEEGNGVKVSANTAVKGAQGWICITSGKRIDADAISSYASLKDSQSFLVTPMGEKLLVEEDDIRGWALLNTFATQILGRSQATAFNMTAGFLFENAESVLFKADFDNGEMESEAKILNEKGKPAKYQLPSEKVDVNALKSIGGNCDALMAFTINSKLIKKFDQLSSLFGMGLFGDLSDTFKNIDGTVGLAGSGDKFSTIRGFVTTKGEVSPILRNLISENIGAVSLDGKYLRFATGDEVGSMEVDQCAEELKGACVGIVFNNEAMKDSFYGWNLGNGVNYAVLKCKPDSGGLEIELEIKTDNPKENALLTLLKNCE